MNELSPWAEGGLTDRVTSPASPASKFAGLLAASVADQRPETLMGLEEAAALGAFLRLHGLRCALTQGSFDIFHYGHSLFLASARRLCDFLIVAVDSDEKVFARKGRMPLIPEDERLLSLTYQRGVSTAILKHASWQHLALVTSLLPDILVTTQPMPYSEQELAVLAEQGTSVRALPRMVSVSTSARLRNAQRDLRRGLFDGS